MIYYIFLVCVYLAMGRFLGFEIYRNDFIYLIIDNKLVKYESKHYLGEAKEYEQNISPKWFRNILRVVSILIWPILFFMYFLCLMFWICRYFTIAFIKFFTD